MKNSTFNIKSRAASLRHALQGLLQFAHSEINGKIQIVVAITVIILGILFDISLFDWTALVLSIAAVLALEIVNTALEKVCNLYSIEKSSELRDVKDLGAAAVLITSVAALVNGILIFVPKIFELMHGVFLWPQGNQL